MHLARLARGAALVVVVLALLLTSCSSKSSRQTTAAPSQAVSGTVTATSGTGGSTATASASPLTSTSTSPKPPTARPTPAPAATTPAPPAPACGAPAGPSAASFPIAAGFPTALAWSPDGRLFWAERSGTVKVYQGGAAKVFATVSTVTTESDGGYSERGLLGLAISPTFAGDHYVYAFYSNADRARQTVVRWTDCGGSGTAPRNLLTFPAGGDCCHKGGRLAFGPDGKLYVTLGEEHDAPAAQNTSGVLGKVLRYNPDGSVPAGNPFGAGNPVWAYGFRNPFGIAFSGSGQLALTLNGPTGDANSPSTGYDMVVFSVAKGGAYQWPACYGYSHPLAVATCPPPALKGPDYSSEATTLVPTGATFVDGSGPAGFANHLVFCTFEGGGQIFTPGSPHGSIAAALPDCRLDIKQGPDHALYYSDTGRISRQG